MISRINIVLKIVVVILSTGLFQACDSQRYNPEKHLTQIQHDSLVLTLAPYVNKKPKKATFPERFDDKYRSYYEACVEGQKSNIHYYYIEDTLHYFYYVNKDLSSLYEHYKGYGGTFTENSQGAIQNLNILFTTPRFTLEEVSVKGKELFSEMVKTGDINTFKGNRAYIHLPNADFEYNRKENRWVYTENSSWNFLKEVKEEN